MDLRFLPHNSHLEAPENFHKRDPHLRQLSRQALVYRFPVLDRLFGVDQPGIYTVSGGRQIGKTTLLKLWMADLLKKGVNPLCIAFLTGEVIDDHHSLITQLTSVVNNFPESQLAYLIVDEVTYIKGWDKAIKYMADAGLLERVVVFVTGSDQVILHQARMRFPGRRGDADTADYHLQPLSFHETVRLKNVLNTKDLEVVTRTDDPLSPDVIEQLFTAFGEYLTHGGYLTAINDMAATGSIAMATYATYSDWVRGDVLKRGKQEHYLTEVLSAIIKRLGTQVTWNNLSGDLSIDHPKTIADYVALLESMDVLFVQPALLLDKLKAAPKKARKVMFSDPFIYFALRQWLEPLVSPYQQRTVKMVQSPDQIAPLVECVTASHFRLCYPTYYIKARGEVDIAYVDRGRFWPVEVKWTSQIRPKDIKQIASFPNGRILDRSRQSREVQGVPTVPLPVALMRLEACRTRGMG